MESTKTSNLKLSPELRNEYAATVEYFEKNMKDTWTSYDDEVIPENIDFDIQIATTIYKIVDYLIDHFNEINKNYARDFLAYFYCDFWYGNSPSEEKTYIAVSEDIYDMLYDLRIDEPELTRQHLNYLFNKYEEFIDELETQ